MQTTIITTCTNRKRRAAPPELRARALSVGATEVVAADWIARIASASDLGPALQLYAGRGFREAVRAAEACEARLLVISAGLGLIDVSADVPAYDLTLSATSEDAVGKKVDGSARDWWAAITHDAGEIDRFGGGLILAALSRPYLSMVADEWAQWPKERLTRLRIFCKEPPRDLPSELAHAWMPYDDRLDQVGEGLAGTQSDFAQRALRHFVEALGVRPLSATNHRAAVTLALSSLTPRSVPVRERSDDLAILTLIRRDWDLVDGRSGAMLRHLRDELLVACEQGRFKRLFKAAAAARREPSS